MRILSFYFFFFLLVDSSNIVKLFSPAIIVVLFVGFNVARFFMPSKFKLLWK